MAHQAHNIPWNVLASNIDWRIANKCKSDATDFHLKFRPDQGKKLTYFVKALVSNIHEHADTERRKYADTYEAPSSLDDIVIDNDVVCKIYPTVRRWRPSRTLTPMQYNVNHHTSAGKPICPHQESQEACGCLTVPYPERRLSAFCRPYRATGCYEDRVHEYGAFNAEVFKTLLLHGEMDTIFRICAYPGTALSSWWEARRCQCSGQELGWSRIAEMALDAYILLNVIHCFPQTWDPPPTTVSRPDDYRRTRSYQFLVWRNTSDDTWRSDVIKYPHRQFFGIDDGQFRPSFYFRDAKMWSHLDRQKSLRPSYDTSDICPFGHLPYEIFLECQQLVNFLPSTTDKSHVRWILCEKGLPSEVAEKVLDFAGFTGRRRLPVPHDPFHPENREELTKYLTYCWLLIVRSEMVARALGMQVNWQNWVSLSIGRLFNCDCGTRMRPQLLRWGEDNQALGNSTDDGNISFN